LCQNLVTGDSHHFYVMFGQPYQVFDTKSADHSCDRMSELPFDGFLYFLQPALESPTRPWDSYLLGHLASSLSGHRSGPPKPLLFLSSGEFFPDWIGFWTLFTTACEMTFSCVLERQGADHVLVYSCWDKLNIKNK